MLCDESEKKIFEVALNRIKEREDSLKYLKEKRLKNKNLGIEGWLKVEIIRAMAGNVIEVKNRGIDLKVEVNKAEKNVELKAQTVLTLTKGWVNDAMRNEEEIKPDICLFLSGYSEDKDIERCKIGEFFKIGEFEVYCKLINPNWILGLIKKS